jgi:hypothetical protein
LAGELGVSLSDFDESFLEEQLERMRRLNERMSQIHDRLVENSESIARDRDQFHGPSGTAVRDVRTHQTHNYPESAPKRRRKR